MRKKEKIFWPCQESHLLLILFAVALLMQPGVCVLFLKKSMSNIEIVGAIRMV
jgi:hypothetical protein